MAGFLGLSKFGHLKSPILGLLLAFPFTHQVTAQSSYPDRSIKMIVPFPPGGVYDAIARPLADKLKTSLGSVVVENIGGAGGTRGVTLAMRAPADGYTLLLGGSANFIVTPIAAKKPAYDPLNDFEPVARIANVGLSFVVHSSLGVRDMKGLIEHARKNPGKVSFGTPGVGTTNHFVGEMLKSLGKLPELAHVPYAGAGPALNDLVGGHIPLLVANVTGQVLELHKAEKVRVLSVTTEKRLSIAPDVPTAQEAGIKGMVAEVFFGVFAPRGTPSSITAKVTEAINKSLADPELRSLFLKSGFETNERTSPQDLHKFLSDEITRWRPIIEASGFKIE